MKNGNKYIYSIKIQCPTQNSIDYIINNMMLLFIYKMFNIIVTFIFTLDIIVVGVLLQFFIFYWFFVFNTSDTS